MAYFKTKRFPLEFCLGFLLSYGSQPICPSIDMKAKEWIATLVPLARAAEQEHQGDAYLEAVEQLHRETRSIIDARLQSAHLHANRDQFHFRSHAHRSGAKAMGTDDRQLIAYREGLVKWDAVVHGVSLALGHEPPFPLFKGGPLIHELNALQTQVQTQAINRNQAQVQFKALSNLIQMLNYQEQPLFKVLLEMIQKALHQDTLRHISTTIDSLKELVDLIQKGEGHTPKAQELHARMYHQRTDLLRSIESLPPRERLTAYLLLGQRMTETAPAATPAESS